MSSCECQTNSHLAFTTITSCPLNCETIFGDQYSENLSSFSERFTASVVMRHAYPVLQRTLAMHWRISSYRSSQLFQMQCNSLLQANPFRKARKRRVVSENMRTCLVELHSGRRLAVARFGRPTSPCHRTTSCRESGTAHGVNRALQVSRRSSQAPPLSSEHALKRAVAERRIETRTARHLNMQCGSGAPSAKD